MNTIKIYDGPSSLDGKRIIVLVSGFKRCTANTKTGNMLQTWILRYDTKPNDAVKNGNDASVCGDCPFRGSQCYVQVHNAPRAVWQAGKDLPVVSDKKLKRLLQGRNTQLRLGSYGDPAAIPATIWRKMLKYNGLNHTGYTHQWHNTRYKLQSLVMASVGTIADKIKANKKG